MSADHPPELRADLLDDFYAECDELLTSSRNALVQVEANLDQPAVVATQIEALFRYVHSIKGNAAIVGLRVAEELAHRMEDLLRGLAKRKFELNAAMIDALLSATQRLGQIVASHRLGRPVPETRDLLVQLAGLFSTGSASPLPVADPAAAATTAHAEAMAPAQTALARGLVLWRGLSRKNCR